MRVTISIFLLVCFSSCLKVDQRKVTAFPDVDSLVRAQILSLEASDASLVKSGTIKGVTSETTTNPDSAQWARELGIFLQADINEARLVDLYEIETSVGQDGVETATYRSLKPSDTPVKWLKVRSKEYIYSLDAEIAASNPIYGSKRSIGMKFSENTAQGRLESYYIHGGEQLTLKDSVTYDLTARVVSN